jgi:L-lactate dehydrogenase complex protein LldG
MSARENILSRIRQNKPSGFVFPQEHAVAAELPMRFNFNEAVQVNGGKVIEVKEVNSIVSFLEANYPSSLRVASDVIPGNVSIQANVEKNDLNSIDVAVVKAELGVAENGALWIPESNMLNRCLPFITQHLMVVLNEKDIVSDMHQAYKLIHLDTYGVFIAGPSKTADIEQSLVIGAHGAITHTVFVLL